MLIVTAIHRNCVALQKQFIEFCRFCQYSFSVGRVSLQSPLPP